MAEHTATRDTAGSRLRTARGGLGSDKGHASLKDVNVEMLDCSAVRGLEQIQKKP